MVADQKVVRWPRQTGRTVDVLISNIDCDDLTMDGDGYLYVSDTEKHEMRRWKIGETNGTIVSSGNGRGNRTDQLYTPYYVFVHKDHSIYVSDYYNHRVMRWTKDAKEGIVVGGNGRGEQANQFREPIDLSFDRENNLYVVEYYSHRVQRFHAN